MADQGDEAGRRKQVMEVAEQLVLARRSLAVSLNDIADELGVSRSLIYVYFDGVPQILDCLFREQIAQIERLLIEARAAQPVFRLRMLTVAQSYLQHLSARGQLILMVLRERHQDSPLGPDSVRMFRRVLRLAAGDLGKELQLDPRAAMVTLELLSAIPEALARLLRSGTVDDATAQATCERLVGAALDALAVRDAG